MVGKALHTAVTAWINIGADCVVKDKQKGGGQIKYSWLWSICHGINVTNYSDHLCVHPSTVRLYQGKTLGITRPLVVPYKQKIKINTKHLPVAHCKECQVCPRFRNVGNDSTNICPAYFGDSLTSACIWGRIWNPSKATPPPASPSASAFKQVKK